MQVSVETTQGLERRMTVEVPSDDIDSAIVERLQSISKTARLNGFRPGKVPFKVVKKRFGDQVRGEVLGDVINRSFQEAVVQEKLRLAGQPQIEPIGDVDAGDFKYAATFEVYPEFEPRFDESIVIDKPVVEIAETDIDDMLDNLRKQRTEYATVERASADGDQVKIDFVGSIDGEEFPGGKAEDAPLVLGSGAMIDGFEEQLIGVSAGDTKTIHVTFPEQYQASELAGKEASFDITVHSVGEARVPELDEELVKSFGIEDGQIDSLRADIRKNMERELEQRVEAQVKQQVMDGLLKLNEVDVPQALAQDEIGRLREQLKQQMPPDASAEHLTDELFVDEANKRVRLGLVVGEIVRSKEIKPDAAAVRQQVEKIASTYQEPEQVIDYYYGNKELMQNVEGLVLEQAVTDSVLDAATVNEKPTSFKDMMNPPEPETADPDADAKADSAD